jgi:signal transduction histidine kinase
VFKNLLENAVQHNDEGTPEVTVSCIEHPEIVRVKIADNGPGVPDDKKRTVFGKGEKGFDSSGTGIGLYLVATLVEQFGGDVSIEDNDPKGSVFVVELPKADSTEIE